MPEIKDYLIPLNGGAKKDTNALKALLLTHANVFDRAILSNYGGDVRYAVVQGSLNITALSDGKIHYHCQVNYFAPCHDQNDFFPYQGIAEYDFIDECLRLKMDETLWNVD